VRLASLSVCARPSEQELTSAPLCAQPITLITDFSSPFDMPPVQDLGGHDWAVQQHKMDPEQHVHVSDVYGVWTAKPWIVKDAAERNPYGSEYFFWVRPFPSLSLSFRFALQSLHRADSSLHTHDAGRRRRLPRLVRHALVRRAPLGPLEPVLDAPGRHGHARRDARAL